MTDKNNLNGWAIGEEAFDWILKNIPKGSTILELGSGTGTAELVKHYTVYSIEHNEEWLNKVPEANYIYGKLLTFPDMEHYTQGWYDLDVLDKLPKNYDLLIIDSPPGFNRVNFKHFISHFNHNVPWLFDDTQRDLDRYQAVEVSAMYQRPFVEIVGKEKNFIVLESKNI